MFFTAITSGRDSNRRRRSNFIRDGSTAIVQLATSSSVVFDLTTNPVGSSHNGAIELLILDDRVLVVMTHQEGQYCHT